MESWIGRLSERSTASLHYSITPFPTPVSRLEIPVAAATVWPCRYTNFIVNSARRTAKSWYVPALGKGRNVRSAARPSWPRSSRSLRHPPRELERALRPALRRRPAWRTAAAAVVAGAVRIGTEGRGRGAYCVLRVASSGKGMLESYLTQYATRNTPFPRPPHAPTTASARNSVRSFTTQSGAWALS